MTDTKCASYAAQRALADIKLDEPFREAVQLVSAVKLPPRDVQELVEKIGNTHSEAQALEVIEEARTKHAPAGPPPQKRNLTKAATDAGRKIDAFLASVKAPAGELAPATLRADLEPKWKRLHDLAGAVLLAFAENAPVETAESDAA